MYYVIEQGLTNKIVQVGVRDFGEDEHNYIKSNDNVTCFFDQELKEKMMEGTGWRAICQEIIEQLDDKVYISFDIDAAWVELLKTLLVTVYVAYFGSRGFEKYKKITN